MDPTLGIAKLLTNCVFGSFATSAEYAALDYPYHSSPEFHVIPISVASTIILDSSMDANNPRPGPEH